MKDNYRLADFDPSDLDLVNRVTRIMSGRLESRATEDQPAARPKRHAGLGGWSRSYLPHYFTHQASSMHHWLFEQCDRSRQTRRARVNCVGPRDSAKSTVVSTAHGLRSAVEMTEQLIWLVGETAPQAEQNLAHIQAELTSNEQLARDYPDACGRGHTWRRDKIVLRNGVAIEAHGKGAAIRGRRERSNRPTLIICDDLQSNGAMESTDRRQKDWDWLTGVLLKAGSARTNVFNLSNAIHRDAIGMRLDRTAGWTSRVFCSIERWPSNMQLWSLWEDIYNNVADPEHGRKAEDFFDHHAAELLAGVELLWPDREDLLTLMKIRAEDGHQPFEREKQSRPINPETCEWPESYFDDHIWFEEWPAHFTLRAVALDPSKGKDSRRGDYSAFAKLQVTDNVCYFDFDLARRPATEIVSDGVEILKEFLPQGFAVEAVQFQELLGADFLEAFERENIVGAPLYLLQNHANKQVRIRTLGPLLSQKRFKVKQNSPGASLTIAQMRDFPDKGSHDDGPDAAEMAIRLANFLLFGPQEGNTIERAVP